MKSTFRYMRLFSMRKFNEHLQTVYALIILRCKVLENSSSRVPYMKVKQLKNDQVVKFIDKELSLIQFL